MPISVSIAPVRQPLLVIQLLLDDQQPLKRVFLVLPNEMTPLHIRFAQVNRFDEQTGFTGRAFADVLRFLVIHGVSSCLGNGQTKTRLEAGRVNKTLFI